MPTYAIYGLVLDSEVALDDLPESEATATNTRLRVAPGEPTGTTQRQLGEEVVTAGVKVRSYQTDSGFRLRFDDTGTFDISADGTVVTWWSEGRSADDAVQTDILGRVLPLALHARGVLTLHASAVRAGEDGIAILAPKGFGKSTLASALVRGGAQLIGDDAVAVEPGDPPRLLSGVQSLRLREDAAAHLEVAESTVRGGKRRFVPSLPGTVGQASTPLRALYLLHPVRALPDGQSVMREPARPTDALRSAIATRKLGELLDGAAGAATLAAVANLVDRVPTFTLSIVRDLSSMDEVVASVLSWHRHAPA